MDKVKDFQSRLADYLTSHKADLLARLGKEKTVSDEIAAALKAALTEFKPTYK